MGLGLLRLIGGIWLLRREVARSRVLQHERINAVIQKIVGSASSRPIEVRVTGKLRSAATTGIFRPVILLPCMLGNLERRRTSRGLGSRGQPRFAKRLPDGIVCGTRAGAAFLSPVNALAGEPFAVGARTRRRCPSRPFFGRTKTLSLHSGRDGFERIFVCHRVAGPRISSVPSHVYEEN